MDRSLFDVYVAQDTSVCAPEDTLRELRHMLGLDRDHFKVSEDRAQLQVAYAGPNGAVHRTARQLLDSPMPMLDTIAPAGEPVWRDTLAYLLDGAVEHYRMLPPHLQPKKVLVILIACGEDTASRTPLEDLANKVQYCQDTLGFEVIALATAPAAHAQIALLGVPEDRCGVLDESVPLAALYSVGQYYLSERRYGVREAFAPSTSVSTVLRWNEPTPEVQVDPEPATEPLAEAPTLASRRGRTIRRRRGETPQLQPAAAEPDAAHFVAQSFGEPGV